MARTNCDTCGTLIINGKCSCSEWKSAEEAKDNRIIPALEEFHEMKKFTITADAPHLGCAVVFFRGDFNDCMKVRKYIYKMKKRPFYDD